MKQPSVLVCGGGGMLASHFLRELHASGMQFVVSDSRILSEQILNFTKDSPQGNVPSSKSLLEQTSAKIRQLDICDGVAVYELLQELKPDIVCNLAAYTKVDDAESDREAAFRVNGLGPKTLAAQIQRFPQMSLLHVSTDYVFGGYAAGELDRKPISETTPERPAGVYGWSKFLGEESVRAELPDRHIIVRTSWLHGLNGPSFVQAIVNRAEQVGELSVVDDQWGSPTWCGWLAPALIELVLLSARDSSARGTFHASSRGNITWYQFAEKILELSGIPAKLKRQSTAELGRPAPRPPYSTLDVGKLEKLLAKDCISWTEGLRDHLQQIGKLALKPN